LETESSESRESRIARASEAAALALSSAFTDGNRFPTWTASDVAEVLSNSDAHNFKPRQGRKEVRERSSVVRSYAEQRRSQSPGSESGSDDDENGMLKRVQKVIKGMM